MQSITSAWPHVFTNQQGLTYLKHCSIAAASIPSKKISTHVGLEMKTLSANIWFKQVSGAWTHCFQIKSVRSKSIVLEHHHCYDPSLVDPPLCGNPMKIPWKSHEHPWNPMKSHEMPMKSPLNAHEFSPWLWTPPRSTATFTATAAVESASWRLLRVQPCSPRIEMGPPKWMVLFWIGTSD